MTCCPSADKVRSSGLSSLPVAQRFLNGPAPLSPQVAVVPKASRATAPRTRSALVLPMSGGLFISAERMKALRDSPVPQGFAVRSGALSVPPAEQVYPTAWPLDPCLFQTLSPASR